MEDEDSSSRLWSLSLCRVKIIQHFTVFVVWLPRRMETHFIVIKECHYYTRETENTLLSTVFVFRKECEKKNWISILWSSCTCQSCVLAHKIQKGVKILQMALFSLIGFSAVWYVEYAIVFSVWILTILTQYCEYLRRILQLLCVCLCHWLNSWTVTCVWETFQNLIY